MLALETEKMNHVTTLPDRKKNIEHFANVTHKQKYVTCHTDQEQEYITIISINTLIGANHLPLP